MFDLLSYIKGLSSHFYILGTYCSLEIIGKGVGADFVDQQINNMVDTETATTSKGCPCIHVNYMHFTL